MSEEENDYSTPEEDKTPGIFSWRELVTQDVEASTKFYTEMFGWTVDSMDMGGGNIYSFFMQGESPIGGMVKPPIPDVPTTWVNYVTVEDLEAKVEQAKSLGAMVCVPIMEIPGKGRFASFVDPQGAPIAFWEYA